MRESTINVDGKSYPLRTCNTVVVGSGAAGLGTVVRLSQKGQKDIALVTEGLHMGTSRNTGSDKQTYYKLTLAGGEDDSVLEMAQTLAAGGCMDGDNALCEAALSAQCFMRLVELGVPFPQNRYGEFIGYKTDHDPRRRATSVGPYTSRRMTEALEAAVDESGVPVYDGLLAVKILTVGGEAKGLLCLDKKSVDGPEARFVVFNCTNLVWATGGPAGMYAGSAYPAGHHGASGVAFETGTKGQNLTEWQYGLASVRPRWNVSGTYMQVLPRFISCDADGSDQREFLPGFFGHTGRMLDMVFLKGYQWPFDVRKVADGSSIIDILVYRESCKGRRVFLDYRDNPGGVPVDFGALGAEPREYLAKAGACFGTPFQRLAHMNQPAVDFYRERGVDLEKEPLEITLAAQHNNGGIAVDCWWQSSLPGLFAVGEAAGTHGVYRPGGSALNSGQVGAARAAEYIAARGTAQPMEQTHFCELVREQVSQTGALALHPMGKLDPAKALADAQRNMSEGGAAVRAPDALQAALQWARDTLRDVHNGDYSRGVKEAVSLYRLRDTLLCQILYLSAMLDYLHKGGKSRGSGLYQDGAGEKPYPGLPEQFRFVLDDGALGGEVQEAACKNGRCEIAWRPVRPIPRDDDFFENVWRKFRSNGNVY